MEVEIARCQWRIQDLAKYRHLSPSGNRALENEIDFRGIMNVFPNILAKNSNFKKLRHGFVDERALITTTLISSCHWKTLVSFCLRKKRPENAFLTLIVNYRKIVQKSKLFYSKQQQIVYLMIYNAI